MYFVYIYKYKYKYKYIPIDYIRNDFHTKHYTSKRGC